VARLTKDAQAAGVPLSGEGGLLKQLTKMVLETALQGEMDAYLGYGRHAPAGRNKGDSRNGTRSKTVVTDVGPVHIDVPRDRGASFTRRMVPKRARRLSGVDDLATIRRRVLRHCRLTPPQQPRCEYAADLPRSLPVTGFTTPGSSPPPTTGTHCSRPASARLESVKR
jgi:hypothetical protein